MGVRDVQIPFYEEIFAMPGVLADPVVLFGYQDILVAGIFSKSLSELDFKHKLVKLYFKLTGRLVQIPDEYLVPDLIEFLRRRGLRELDTIDLFDDRAALRFDMNYPIPDAYRERYQTFIDLGSLEHVFDTRQCLENCLRMVRPGGHYLLSTPVNGHFDHGLHTFSPEALLQALTLNDFEIVYHAYSTQSGKRLKSPNLGRDVVIWLLGRKLRSMGAFQMPQQGRWRDVYTGQTAHT
jgi:hypothetical protein